MTVREELASWSRPLRRHITPWWFKELYVNRALSARRRPIYLEIGVRSGESFRLARAAVKIGVDPQRHPDMAELFPGERFFEETSDAFFESSASAAFGDRLVDVALIDGYHEFGQALRDVINAAELLAPDGVILLDDCNPRTSEQASETATGGPWNGDVWKVIPLLRAEFPELTCVTIDADEGIGVVAKVGGRKLRPNEAAITDLKGRSYEYLAANRSQLLKLTGAVAGWRLLGDRDRLVAG